MDLFIVEVGDIGDPLRQAGPSDSVSGLVQSALTGTIAMSTPRRNRRSRKVSMPPPLDMGNRRSSPFFSIALAMACAIAKYEAVG